MKKILIFLITFIVLLIPINVYADDASVNIEIVGAIEKGSSIDILVNLKDVERFYAASVDFIYDTSQLKVESIVATEFITKHSSDIIELGSETTKNGNTASYSFTFLGDNEGISGSGTLVKIKANILNDEKLVINQDNMKLKLVRRNEDTVENYSYNFLGYSVSDTNNNQANNNINNNNSNDKENTTENKTNNSANDTESYNNTINNNDDEKVLKEDDKRDENQIENIEREDDYESSDNKNYKNEYKSSSNSKKVILLVVSIGIITLIAFITKLKK